MSETKEDDLAKNVNDAFDSTSLAEWETELGVREKMFEMQSQEDPNFGYTQIIAALADGCARIIEASARANSGGSRLKGKGEI